MLDASKLIAVVREFAELYNPQHPKYADSQRRDDAWKEIGRKLNCPGLVCKNKWTRIRDNHRKALILRKSKFGREALKMKPPKFARELRFLTPFWSLDDDTFPNLSVSDLEINVKDLIDENEDSSKAAATDNRLADPCETSSLSSMSDSKPPLDVPSSYTRNKMKFAAQEPQQYGAAVLQNYLQTNEDSSDELAPDLMMEFFANMARTVKTFPLKSQLKIKGQLFQMVLNEETSLLQEALSSNSSSSASSSSSQRQPQQTLLPNSGFSKVSGTL